MDIITVNRKVSIREEEEVVNSKITGETSVPSISSDEINEKYVKGEVRIVTEQARYPLNTIVSMVENSSSYILNPEFQRRHRWDHVRKSRLIESFIMNIPIPPIFLYEKEFAVYEVMDGLQRLTAIKQFYNNEFKLSDLIEWPELNGFSYNELPEKVKKGIDRRYLSSIILLQETAKTADEAQRLKQLVFERINSGGEKLNAQESRNAIYNGKFNQLCIDLARNEAFCRMWSIPLPTQAENNNKEDISSELITNPLFSKMEDVELVLRFFAFRKIDSWQDSLQNFLDEALDLGNDYSDKLLEELSSVFRATVELTYEVLGDTAFHIYRKRESRRSGVTWDYFDRPTKLAYDPIMYVFSTFLDSRKILIEKRHSIQNDIVQFYQDNYSKFGERSNRSDVITRINLFSDFIQKYVC